MRNTRSQVVVGYLLLIVIVIAVVSSAYFYITPVIEKSKGNNEVESLESSIIDLIKTMNVVVDKKEKSKHSLSSSLAGSVEINNEKIIIRLKTPTKTRDTYYIIPENVFYCEGPSSVDVGETLNLCGLNVTYVHNNGTHVIIEDKLFNSTLILPLGDYRDVLVSFKVFDIESLGSSIRFIWKDYIGISIFKDSRFTLKKSIEPDEVVYEINGRYIYDPINEICYKYTILPYGNTVRSFPGNIDFSISYWTIEQTQDVLSTMCGKLINENIRVELR